MTYIEFTDKSIEGVLAVDENSPSENGVIDWLIDNNISFKVISEEEYEYYPYDESNFEIK